MSDGVCHGCNTALCLGHIFRAKHEIGSCEILRRFSKAINPNSKDPISSLAHGIQAKHRLMLVWEGPWHNQREPEECCNKIFNRVFLFLSSVFTVFHLLLKTTKFKFFLTFIFCQWREPCRRCWFQRRHKNVSVKEGFASPPSFQIYWQSRTAEVPPASSKLNTTYRYILYIFFLFFSLPP